MKPLSRLYFIPLILFVACGDEINRQDSIAEINVLVEFCAKDFENADIASFVNRGADEFKFFTLDGQSFDKKGTENFLKPMFDRWKNRKMQIEDLDIFVDKNISWARYKSIFTFNSQYGQNEMVSLNTIIFQKDQDQDWKLLHFHMSRL